MSVSERHLESRNSVPSAGQWTQDTLFPRLDSFGGRQRVDYKYWLFSALKCASKTMRWDYAKWVAESDCLSCVWGEFWEWEWRLDAALGWPARSQTQRRHSKIGWEPYGRESPTGHERGKRHRGLEGTLSLRCRVNGKLVSTHGNAWKVPDKATMCGSKNNLRT